MISKRMLDELQKMPRAELIGLHIHIGKMISKAPQEQECRKGFDRWYDGLPAEFRIQRGLAFKSWLAIWVTWSHGSAKSMFLTMRDAVEFQIENDHFVNPRDGIDYRPRAVSWLNQERWLDHVKRRRRIAGTTEATPREDRNRALTPGERGDR